MAERFALASIPLFEHLSASCRRRLQGEALLEQYEKGAALFRQGDRAEHMWVILEGWVHLIRAAAPHTNGRGAVLFTITPTEGLCGISAIESGTYNFGAVAATTCRAVRIPAALFNEALRQEPVFAYHVVRLCARRIQHIAQQYGAIAEPVAHRVIRALQRLQKQFGLTIPMTHRELAQMSWTTTESAIRIIRMLKRRGMVDGTRAKLIIRQPEALTRLLESGPPAL